MYTLDIGFKQGDYCCQHPKDGKGNVFYRYRCLFIGVLPCPVTSLVPSPALGPVQGELPPSPVTGPVPSPVPNSVQEVGVSPGSGLGYGGTICSRSKTIGYPFGLGPGGTQQTKWGQRDIPWSMSGIGGDGTLWSRSGGGRTFHHILVQSDLFCTYASPQSHFALVLGEVSAPHTHSSQIVDIFKI